MFEIPVLERLLLFSNYAVMIGANLLVHSTILIIMGLCVAYAFRNKGAAVQSLVLRAFLAAVLLCPVVSVLLDDFGLTGITFDVPVESFSHFDTSKSFLRLTQKDDNIVNNTITEKEIFRRDSEHKVIRTLENYSVNSKVNEYKSSLTDVLNKNEIHSFFMNWRAVLYIVVTIIWLSVSAFYFIKLLVHFLRIMYIRKNADDTELEVFKESRAIAYRLESEIPLLLKSPHIESPFLTGIFKPAIIFPEGITATREVLIHEFAHLVRRDCFWNLLSYIGRALLPIQPLMKVLSDCMENTSDYACDDYVVKFSSDPKGYAAQLVDFAENFQSRVSDMLLVAGIISFKSSLRRRVERILEKSGQIFVSARAGIVIIIIFLCLGATVLTVLISFKGDRDYAAKNLPGKVEIDKPPFVSSAADYKPKFSVPENLTASIPVFKVQGVDYRTSDESESGISEAGPEAQTSESLREKVDTDEQAINAPDSRHTPDSSGAEEPLLATEVNFVTDMESITSFESPAINDIPNTEANTNESILKKGEDKKPAKEHKSDDSGIEEFLLRSRINFAQYKKSISSLNNGFKKFESEMNWRKVAEDIRKYNPYNSKDSFSWEVMLSDKE